MNIAKEIDKEADEITWSDLENELKNISSKDENLIDINGYSRGQQASDYVYRVRSYYNLLAAHSCTKPKDQLTFF